MPMKDGPLHVARLQMSCWSCLASVANRMHNAWNGRECVGLAAQIPSLTRAGQSEGADDRGCHPHPKTWVTHTL